MYQVFFVSCMCTIGKSTNVSKLGTYAPDTKYIDIWFDMRMGTSVFFFKYLYTKALFSKYVQKSIYLSIKILYFCVWVVESKYLDSNFQYLGPGGKPFKYKPLDEIGIELNFWSRINYFK